MITTSCAIHVGMAEIIENEKRTTIMTSIKQIINSYNARVFKVMHILGDGKFSVSSKH